ncbi:MAG: DMT family transporter [Clostridia bacterium]|nr:DMT family transporter [Clostridia bacterium]
MNEVCRSNKDEKKPPKEKKTWLGIVYIVISAFCFSLMSVCVRKAGDLPTFQKAFFRNGVAAVAGFIMLAKSRSFKMQKGSFVPLILRSIVGTVGIIGNFYAIDRMNISDASILNKLAPFFSVLFSIWILKEKASVFDLLFVAVAFGGALFVVKPSFDVSEFFPALVGVFGGLGAGMAYTFVRKLSNQGERGPFIVFFFSVFSCLAILPIVIVQFQPMEWQQVVWLLLAGCAASGAQFSVTAAYAHAPAKEISVYDYSQVLFTALWGVLIFGEFPDWLSAIGYVIIIGAAIAKYFVGKKKRRNPPTQVLDE